MLNINRKSICFSFMLLGIPIKAPELKRFLSITMAMSHAKEKTFLLPLGHDNPYFFAP